MRRKKKNPGRYMVKLSRDLNQSNDHSSDRRFIKSIFQESSDPGDVFMLSVYERLNTVLLPKSKNKIGGKCCQNPPNTRS